MRCPVCGKSNRRIAEALGACVDCIRRGDETVLEAAKSLHRNSRAVFGLPGVPPRDEEGILCKYCQNRCRISEGERGFCGIRRNTGKGLVGGGTYGVCDWYHDPLPTNCVAGPFCPGGTGTGYPDLAYREGPEFGYSNLAVFLEACNFDCFFCQNWHYKKINLDMQHTRPAQMADAVTDHTACICFFGGDPSCQAPFAIRAATIARQRAGDRILRICWETNGGVHPRLMRTMVDLSIESGGCVKFDLKAANPHLHRTMTGTENRQTLENFTYAGSRIRERPAYPLVMAGTTMVPGYIDAEEVGAVARFIASVNPDIPYNLLAFHPHYLARDLPTTSRKQAEACKRAALDAGLSTVRIGNLHLLR